MQKTGNYYKVYINMNRYNIDQTSQYKYVHRLFLFKINLYTL